MTIHLFFKTLFFLFISLSIQSQLIAKTSKKTKTPRKTNAEAITEEKEKIRFGVGVTTGLSLGFLAGPQVGVEGYVRVNKYLSLGASYSVGSTDVTDFVTFSRDVDDDTDVEKRIVGNSVGLSRADITSDTTSLFSRISIADGFAITVVGGVQNTESVFDIYDYQKNIPIDFRSSRSTNYFGILVGNHWELDNQITFGFDWVGFLNQSASSASSNIQNVDHLSDDASTVYQDAVDLEQMAHIASSFPLFNFSLGYLF